MKSCRTLLKVLFTAGCIITGTFRTATAYSPPSVGTPADSIDQNYRAELRIQEVNRALKNHLPAMDAAYDALLKENPAAKGRIGVKIQLKEDGSVTYAGILHSEEKNEKFERTVVNILFKVRFPARKSGSGLLEIIHQFDFAARKKARTPSAAKSVSPAAVETFTLPAPASGSGRSSHNSRSRTRMLYIADNACHLLTMNNGTVTVRQITPQVRHLKPVMMRVSPNGQRIVYVLAAAGNRDVSPSLHLTDFDPATRPVCLSGSGPDDTVHWPGLSFSPDSRYVFFIKKAGAGLQQLWAADISRPEHPTVFPLRAPVRETGLPKPSPDGWSLFHTERKSSTSPDSLFRLSLSIDPAAPRFKPLAGRQQISSFDPVAGTDLVLYRYYHTENAPADLKVVDSGLPETLQNKIHKYLNNDEQIGHYTLSSDGRHFVYRVKNERARTAVLYAVTVRNGKLRPSRKISPDTEYADGQQYLQGSDALFYHTVRQARAGTPDSVGTISFYVVNMKKPSFPRSSLEWKTEEWIVPGKLQENHFWFHTGPEPSTVKPVLTLWAAAVTDDSTGTPVLISRKVPGDRKGYPDPMILAGSRKIIFTRQISGSSNDKGLFLADISENGGNLQRLDDGIGETISTLVSPDESSLIMVTGKGIYLSYLNRTGPVFRISGNRHSEIDPSTVILLRK